MQTGESISASVLHKLGIAGGLSQDDFRAFCALNWTRARYAKGTTVRLKDCVALVGSGWAGQSHVLNTGKRQLTALYVEGELCSFEALLGPAPRRDFMALTPLTIWCAPLNKLAALAEARPAILNALMAALSLHRDISEQMLLSLGSRPALERMAHFLCELHFRASDQHLGRGGSFALPLTQSEMGEYLALSSVHVNRTLQALRRLGLISTSGGELCVHDAGGLAALAGFDPRYLKGPGRTKGEQGDARRTASGGAAYPQEGLKPADLELPA